MLLLLNSCTSGTSTGSEAGKPMAASSQPVTDTIVIRDMKFTPEGLVVKKGDKIVFVNSDMVDHCVTGVKENTWTSGVLKSGASYTLTASESSDYFCAIHKVMKGTIIVQ